MSVNDEGHGTGPEGLTVESAAPGFEAYLSALEDDKAPETPPTPQSPASEPDEAEASPEPADAEGESEEPETDPNEQPENPETSLDPNTVVRVVIDGAEQEVTLEEALKGYSRQSDYTRKTQELAAARKAQETEFQGVRGERAKYAGLITQLEQALHEATGPEPDWAKIQTDHPDDFPAMWAQWQHRQGELKTVADERQRAQQAVQRDQAEQRQQYLEGERTKLVEAIPEWKTAETAKADKAKLVAYAAKVGFTQDELREVVDHRALVMLRKAMLFDEAQAKRPAITQRIEKIRTATPGPTPQAKKPVSDSTRARQRLAKTGRVEDAAAAFGSMLDDSL